MSFTIGSLFDGSGGFPLAATMCGGTPKWSSEIEPYPIAVTKSRFPNVKHLGSVTDIKGGEIEPVDVITFGSPCQDLSVAGKRAGLKHTDNGDDETTRSGLFMEAVRIIKEMREATNGVYPRFALWENVPGAFSSNKGEDFRIVLEELIKVVEPTAVMPEVPKNGWPYADSYCGDGWSLAYRVLDAQFWGVPQRRRRIYLVADFRGECAGKISFEREGLRGYFETGRTPWKTVAGDAESGSGTADCERKCYGIVSKGNGEAWTIEEKHMALSCGGGQAGQGYPCVMQTVAYSFDSLASNSMKSKNPHSGCRAVEVAKTLYTTDPNPSKNQGGIAIVEQIVLDDQGGQQIPVRTDGKTPTLRAEMHGNVPCVMEQHLFENHSQDARYKGPLDVCPMLPAQLGTGGNNTPLVMESVTIEPGIATREGGHIYEGGCGTIRANAGDNQMAVAYALDQQGGGATSQNSQGMGYKTGTSYTLNTTDVHGVACLEAVSLLGDKVSGTLMARDYKGIGRYDTLGSAVCIPTPIRYIVRRLTPTECARLQGFPDTWGHPIEESELTDEEYQFWLNVRNTHAAINDKPTKEYTKDQILKWYNGLHTDSSEYKMWGNGIALPNALYVMQGIADVMSEEKAARRKWLDDLLGGCL